MATNPEKQPSTDFAHVVWSWRLWWRQSVVGTVDQADVIEKRREECALSARYLFMLMMSAGIAILGLLLSSPAVVIGAMLLSPLMGPIMGLGFALAIGDFGWTKQSAKTLAIGTLLSILFCAFIVFLSPLQTVTSEIAARTRPNLFDLLVALFSALAGAYAMIRGREGTVVGVAIATALMPPLAVVGFGLATLNGTVFWGALLLFFTNLMTIALTAAIMARLYGFHTSLSERNTQVQYAIIIVAFVALAVPLGLTLRQIAWETQATRTIRGAVLDSFEKSARLSDIQFNWESDPIGVEATVLTPQLQPDAETLAEKSIAREVGQPVDIVLTQYQVGTASQAAEQAQLAVARAKEQAAAAQATEIGERLALIAGVGDDAVTVDRQRRHATVTAKPISGAGLGVYREIEARLAKGAPEWEIELRPPVLALPSIPLGEGKPNDAGQKAITLIAWAARRLDLPVILAGPDEVTAAIADELRVQGIAVEVTSGGSRTSVTADWDV